MKPIGLVPELLVTDLKKSLSFYIEKLGFVVLYGREEEHFVFLQKGNAQIMVEQLGVGRNWVADELAHPFGRGVNFQIEVEDVESLYKTVEQNDLKFFMPLEEKWYKKDQGLVGNKQFIIQDPDGYLLRFYQDLGGKQN